MKRLSLSAAPALALCGLMAAAFAFGAAADAGKKPRVNKRALERTRKQVRMLDDIYKTAVVLITDKYVNDADDFPAGSAAIALFSAIKEKGWHEARLLDATGMPYNEKNAPKDDFEKAAIDHLKAGAGYYEQVVVESGKPYLRAATPIPVVMKKCVMCHSHYEDAKKGEAIGAISYKLRIE